MTNNLIAQAKKEMEDSQKDLVLMLNVDDGKCPFWTKQVTLQKEIVETRVNHYIKLLEVN